MSSHAREIAAVSEALKSGRFDEAGQILAGILDSDPKCAEAHHFYALLLTQNRDPLQALVHAEEAIALDPENVRFRGNLGATLIMVGELEAALPELDRAIAAAPEYVHARRNRGKVNAALERFDEAVADFTAAIKLEPNRTETRIALADVLVDSGRFEEAADVLKTVQKIDGGQSPQWQFAWGRLMYRLGRFLDAHETFNQLLHADPNNMNHYVAVAAASFHCGHVEEARRATRTAFAKFPYIDRGARAPEARVLVLEAHGHTCFDQLPRGAFNHRRGNFTGHMRPQRVALTHVICDGLDSLGDVMDLERFDLAYNNRVIYELVELYEQQEQVARIAAELPCPVLNRPEGVALTTRDGNSKRFANAERFIFPRTLRVAHAFDVAQTKSRILDSVKLPMILRPLYTHVGIGAIFVQTEQELETEIAKRSFSDFYAIEYHDCQSDDGLFRRYRFACLDGALSSNSLHLATQWNVHGAERSDIDWFERGFDQEEITFYEEPERLFDEQPESVFEEIISTTPLEIYGIDFGFRRDGRIIIFEVNAAMALAFDADVKGYPYRKPYSERFARDVEAYFIERGGGSAA